ncbi:MAG: histidine kinase, partial [Alphaproteobacteria bacterium]|nr:histidine kinase [Alphaproteobacteria bacterium]
MVARADHLPTDEGAAEERVERRRLRRRRRPSPLTWRILAVNVLALAILVGGLLYLGVYRDNLVATKTASLVTQGQIVAGALGASAVEIAPSGEAEQVEVSA